MRIHSLLTLLCFLLSFSLAADEASTPLEKQFAADLMASSAVEELLASKKDQVTPQLCELLLSEGKRLRTLGDFSASKKAYETAQAAGTQLADKHCLAQAIRGVGIIDSIQGNNADAIQHYEESLALAKEIGDKTLIAGALRSIGIYYVEVGNDDSAVDYFQQTLAIAEELGDNKISLPTLLNLGVVSVDNGDFSQGLRYYTKMLAIKELQGSPDLLASTFNNIAIVYDYQGDTRQALEYYEKSMKIRQEMGDKANIANLLNNMGDDRLLGDVDRALEYNRKSLAIAEEIGDKSLIGRAFGTIGSAYRKKGDYDQALEYATKAIQVAREINDPEMLNGQLRKVALIYYLKGDYDKTLQDAREVADRARHLNSRQDLWDALELQGKAYRALNQPEKARQAFEDSIATIEDWRSYIAGGEIEQLSQFAEKASVYYDLIDLMIAQNQIKEAFHDAERVKSRVLLDVLHSGKVDISRAMSMQEIGEEKKLRRQIVELNQKLEQAKENAAPQARDALQKARLDFESFRTELYVNHPELKVARGEALPITIEDAKKQLDADTAALEFIVTESKTYLFVLSKQSGITPKVYSIPVQEEELARRVRLFRGQIADRDLRVQKAAKEMYQLLLAQAAPEIASKKKLLIVPDEVLWELPFQVLQDSSGRYLLQDHAICYTPSLTVYKEMRHLRKEEQGTKSTLLAFGNPAVEKENVQQLSLLYRDENLAPLPEAEKEVRSLETLYGEAKSKVYIGKEAREDYLKREAGNFKILHFATHGILNDVSPLYSQILLTQGGSPAKEDGLLEAWEIMNLNLRADLVVLSACETALGKVRRGEGMIGLTWAFFIAGAPATVVSQWKVNSASTTELMVEFHKQLKTAAPAVSKAEALQKAALHLMQTTRYRHPFYWAPFVLIGDGL